MTDKSTPQISYETAVEFLQGADIEFLGKEKRINGIVLPLTPEDWCRLCQVEGDSYMGGCCGTYSNLQDIYNSVFREGGYLSGPEFREIADIHIGHGDGWWESWDVFSENIFVDPADGLSCTPETYFHRVFHENHPAANGPMAKICAIWWVVRDYLSEGYEARPRVFKHRSPVSDAARVVEKSLMSLGLVHLFSSNEGDVAERMKATSAARVSQMWGALKLLYENLPDLYQVEWEGYAIVDQSDPDRVALRGSSYAFGTLEELKELLKELERLPAEEEQSLAVRACRIDRENGIVLSGELL